MIKKKMMKKIVVVGLTLALAVGALAGCGGKSTDTGSIVIAGSTSVQPLSEAIAGNYMNENKDVKIEVQGGGSGQAVKSLKEEIAQIGALSREVKDGEKEAIAKEYVFAKDGVAVVVNKDVNVTDLTIEQIKKIYSGEITNWKEVGGADAEISVVSREAGSGTRGAFTEITGVLSKDAAGAEVDSTTQKALVQPSTGAVLETVTKTPNAIGYVSLEAVNDKVTAVTVEGVKISKETVLDGTYKISRPFIYAVGANVNEATQKFIDFVMSAEGQKLVEENGFIPVK
ncbi:MAG: phosphate ABC transporter substrate-binding protein [Anaerovoracaceae bacterium]